MCCTRSAAAGAGVERVARDGARVAVGAGGALVHQPGPGRRAPAARRLLAAQRGQSTILPITFLAPFFSI